jgi:hypothetical protein
MSENIYYDFYNFQMLNEVKCPILAILSSIPRTTAAGWRSMKKALELLSNKQNFQRINVRGNHDVHMNNPDRVAPYIVKFLTTKKCAL